MNATAKQTKTLRFSRSLIERAEAIAKKEKRSFNNWLEMLIEREVNDETNYLLSSPENAKWLRESIEQLKRGETVKYEL